MAFSFRAGTNWYHDFPKLARESGFYFNAHTARVRVDWNRISTIDIDRVIRDRDFQIVDDNVNNVIDYYLESDCELKILDPNFVKLFRLAQLAVEYLLYCKQYLDQSVVILKEELKYKLEENVKLKDEVTRFQTSVKEMREKYKEKSKAVELKSDTHSEIHKCPYCPKTFVSAKFANDHLIRRHSSLSDVLSHSSPAHEEHRAETEKLHNEIKMLKERLNQTERVIRNESNNNRICDVTKRERILHSIEDGDSSLHDDQYRRYQEEISNLKSMLFTEIRNIKRKESSFNYKENEVNHETIKDLVNQQEGEIQRLKNQLQEHLTSNANEVQTKLVKQEEYWKSKIEQLENQHHKDIENLFSQLKLTQESASRIKSEYEEKVTVLEKQSMDQSKLLNSQTEKLHNLSKELIDSKKQINYEVFKTPKQKIDSFVEDDLESETSQNPNKSIKKTATRIEQPVTSNQSYNKLFSSSKRIEEPRKIKVKEEIIKEPSQPKYQEKKLQKMTSHRKKIIKAGNKYSSLEESGKSETSSVTETDTETEEDSDEEISESSYSRTESTNDDTHSDLEEELEMTNCDNQDRRHSSLTSLETVKQELQEVFVDKLRDLGIDPEWDGVPAATFNQKMEKIKHQQNMNSKKFSKYEQIRKKLIDEVSKRISINQKSPKKFENEKKSFLNKAVKNVKSKALKAFNELKIQKNNDTSTPISSSKNSTPRESQTKRIFSLELLPKKPTHQDIQEIKRQVRLDSARKQKLEEMSPKKKSSYYNEESIRQHVVETILESPKPRIKQLQRSYQSVGEFLKDIEDATKLDMTSTKVTSTPSKNIKNILQDTFGSELDSQMNKQDTNWALASPKNSKSVLKSTNGAMGSLVKKKVLFDLEKENSFSKESTVMKSAGELMLKNFDEKKELNDSDWNISSISEEKEKITVQEKNMSTENIQLKTSQSEKIAEISKKIHEKLEASRRKPTGSIEAMFTAKTFLNDQDENQLVLKNQNSFVENSTSHIELKPRSNPSQVPRPAPRKQLFGTKDPDLDTDIEDFLAMS